MVDDMVNKLRFWDLEKQVKDDPKVMLNTLVRYFGGVDALWYAVHEHITDLNDFTMHTNEEFSDMIDQLEYAYSLAVTDVMEKEFLVNDDE